MKFGISVPNFGTYSDPRLTAALAREAEQAGWDGFFLWDHMLWTWPEVQPGADPYVLMAAMAMATERIKLGPMVTPIARRRPWNLARALTTLDQLSGGRIIFGAGIGGDWFGDYSKIGQPADDKSHAEMLDEGLAVLDGLWSGEPFSFEGKHYTITDVQFLPGPMQRPRIPVWVAGRWPHKKPFRRAAQWDGVFPIPAGEEMRELTPRETRELTAYTLEHRTSGGPFDVVISGSTTGNDRNKDADHVAQHAQAGATWWLEDLMDKDTVEKIRERIGQGPPRF
jgi:alkanesulfonate monooxygenase SsuD/methylene tetrahydromethanopterin reductase-like flavin-dependent oxidoreductase (luciferase family)